jgi:sulfopropanediol 3-dehydrogenase
MPTCVETPSVCSNGSCPSVVSLPSESRLLKAPSPPAPAITAEVSRRVETILLDIERRGLGGVRGWSDELDGWNPESFRATSEEFETAAARLSPELKEQIAFAQEQIGRFARAQRETMVDLEIETLPGVFLGHRHIPVSTVGAYIPGGRYPMFASSFMTVLVAKAAGVENVIACAPPQPDGGPYPAILYAAWTSGADAVLTLGGVQALAAMAFGLIEGLPAVDMLVGAGNAYVAEAKRQLFGRVGIDLLAGPTELVVIADGSADPRLVAADLLGQAEHGPTSPVGVIAIGGEVGAAVAREVERLLPEWPTADVADVAWREHGWIAVAEDDDEAIRICDAAANEHVEVQVDDSKLDMYRDRLRNYGSLFLGSEATVAYGDKAVGTNHVLPTLGGARYTGGLWVGKFLKTCTWQRLTEDGTRAVAPVVEGICQAEGFAGHALTARMRLERLERR